jgi:hypothetical protein
VSEPTEPMVCIHCGAMGTGLGWPSPICCDKCRLGAERIYEGNKEQTMKITKEVEALARSEMSKDEEIKTLIRVQCGEHGELAMKHMRQIESVKNRPAELKPGDFWLVEYECRMSVVEISPLGDGFWAPGQEVCWGFSAAKFIKRIETNQEKGTE